MLDDISLKEPITTEQYTLTPIFGAVQVKIKDVPHTYTLVPYSTWLRVNQSQTPTESMGWFS